MCFVASKFLSTNATCTATPRRRGGGGVDGARVSEMQKTPPRREVRGLMGEAPVGLYTLNAVDA
jgi:hypothetical protein